MFDANIFMVGIENRSSDPNCSFNNMKELYMIPLMESFKNILIHEMVYNELDLETKNFLDSYLNKNVTIVSEERLYGIDPLYTTIFNEICSHERVQYIRGNAKDRGEVYSLAYAAYHNINYFSSKEIMVDDIARDLDVLKDIEIITFDIIVLLSYIYYACNKRYCEDVIKRHKLPSTLTKYVFACKDYI